MTKISQLTEATSLTGLEELPIVQTSETKKTTLNDIFTFAALPGPLTSEWRRFPSLCRLLLNGTGTVTIDARNKSGTATSAVFVETITGASNAVRFPYFGDDAYEIRATLTGTATVEII